MRPTPSVGSPRRQLLPVGAAVGRFVEPAARPVRRRIDAPRRTARVPQRRVDGLRRRRIEGEIDRADVVALEQHLLPGRAAVARAIDAAIRVGAVDMTERGDEDDVGVLRDRRARVPICRVLSRPMCVQRLSGVGGLVHPVAVRDLRSHVGLAGADVDDVGIGRRDANRADRGDRLRVEDRDPGAAGVRRLPDAAADRSEVERVRLSRHAADAVDASAAKRPDHPPAQARVDARVHAALLGHDALKEAGGQGNAERQNENRRTSQSCLSHVPTAEGVRRDRGGVYGLR